jgi:hypothetical protein
MRNLMKLAGALCAALAVASSSAHAALIVYTDKASFLADTGAASATGPLPTATIDGSFPLPVFGSIVFIPSGGHTINIDPIWSSVIPGNDLQVGGGTGENFAIDPVAPVFAMGFDAHEPSGGTDSTFVISLLFGATPLGTASINFPDDQLAFFGIWSDTAFARLLVLETIGGIENEYFGEVYTSTRAYVVPPPPPPAGIPEPMTLSLFAAGLAGMGWLRRRAG